MKTKFLIVSLFIANFIFAQTPTTLLIEYLSAQEQKYELAKLGRMEFSDDIFNIIDELGNIIATGNVVDLKKMTFSDSIVSNLIVNQNLINVYPNPTMDVLCIEGLEFGNIVRIYSAKGTLLKTVEVNSVQTSINVKDLPNGTYLIQTNTQIVKFIKK
ncbi:MAG: T9SS type A sorting domain-containing protein [Paludibacteraceae bacterium]|nr:T9SS type A sorting domain-containing protein [Paludibacteraceae bacterium]